MIISRMNLNGNPSVGAFILATDKYTLVPPGLSKGTIKRIRETFGTSIVEITIGGSKLMGVYATGTSQGLVVPFFTYDYELEKLKISLKIEVARVPGKITANGNTIIANDNAGIAHPETSDKALTVIQDTLGVKVYKASFANSPLVGSIAAVANSGILVHPQTTEEELEMLHDFFKVNIDIGTINRGSPYVGAGLVVNSMGAITSKETTGPELARISQTFQD